MSKLYEIDINDAFWVDKDKDCLIRRVPGGWIYTEYAEQGISSVFVPEGAEGEEVAIPGYWE